MTAAGFLALWAWLAPGLAFLLLSLVVPLRRSGKPAAWLSIVISLGALVGAVSAWRATVPDMARRMLWDWIPVEDGVLTSVGVLVDADATLMLILVALVSFRFAPTFNVFMGFGGLILGIVAVFLDMRRGSNWYLSVGLLVLFGLVIAASVS